MIHSIIKQLSWDDVLLRVAAHPWRPRPLSPFRFKPWYLEECSSTLTSTYSSGTPGLDRSVATVDMDGNLRPDHVCTVEHTGTAPSSMYTGTAPLSKNAD